ncbi:MAG: tetratricopeptide repeat protein [Nitrospiria bacterium]
MSVRKSEIIQKAQKLASKGQFRQAIEAWKKLIAEFPNDGNIYNAIGDLHLKAFKIDDATTAFLQAAEVFRSSGFEMKCIAVFKKALKVDPSRTEIFEQLADVYAERGLIGNAIDDYLIAAKHYLKDGDFRSSLSVYRKLANLEPENSDIRLKIAAMCHEQGFDEEAVIEYKNLLKLYREMGQHSKAEGIIQDILLIDPSYSEEDGSSSDPPLIEDSVSGIGEISEKSDKEVLLETSKDFSSTEDVISDFLEPEPEPLSEEQTLYASEDLISGEIVQNPVASPDIPLGTTSSEDEETDPSLENFLKEAEIYCNYGLPQKAVEHLKNAVDLFPSRVEPHIKLKEIFYQQADREKIVEECSILARLHEEAGDEEKRELVLNELMTVDPERGVRESSASHEDLEPLTPYKKETQSLNLTTENPQEIPGPLQDSSDTTQNKSEEGLETGPELEEDFFSFDLDETTDLDEPGFDIEQSDPLSLASPLEDLDPPAQVTDEVDSLSLPETNEIHKKRAGEKGPLDPNYIDLQGVLSEDLDEDEISLEKTIRYFQSESREEKNKQEVETQYDLGIAYKEMGMISESIKAFQSASQGITRFRDGMVMTAACYRDEGLIDKALKTLEEALIDQRCMGKDAISLKYELALLYEQNSEFNKAAFLYKEIFQIDPSFRNVAHKRTVFQTDFSEQVVSSSEERTSGLSDRKTGKRNRISYI